MDTNNQDSGVSRDLEEAISSSLRQIPKRWADFEDDALTKIEQRALFLLVAAGLVERRISIRGEFAGQGPSIEFTIDVTGENGLAEAMEPVIAEMWTKWGPAFEEWKASEAGTATPFRFTRIGLDRWRLTERGVLARSDLDIQTPSSEATAFLGCYQRVIEYITRTGHQADRPMVPGQGRLVEMNRTRPGNEKPEEPMSVSIDNLAELTAAIREALIQGLKELFQKHKSPPSSPDDDYGFQPENWSFGDDNDLKGLPPLTVNEVKVIKALATFHPSRLASSAMIETEMRELIRLSQRTIKPIIARLIGLELVERPLGERNGVRLTLSGRRLSSKIAP